MKYFIIALIVSFTLTSTLIHIFDVKGVNTKQEPTNLEIYTLENIYYINGLTVTDENSNPPIRFNTQAELKKYISDITVSDNQEGLDCLENKYQ
jgi:hypothetical protein